MPTILLIVIATSLAALLHYVDGSARAAGRAEEAHAWRAATQPFFEDLDPQRKLERSPETFAELANPCSSRYYGLRGTAPRGCWNGKPLPVAKVQYFVEIESP